MKDRRKRQPDFRDYLTWVFLKIRNHHKHEWCPVNSRITIDSWESRTYSVDCYCRVCNKRWSGYLTEILAGPPGNGSTRNVVSSYYFHKDL